MLLLCVPIAYSLFIAVYYSSEWIYHNLFIHSPTDTLLCCFQSSVITKKVSMSVYEYILLFLLD
jgi:hypothetical protein